MGSPQLEYIFTISKVNIQHTTQILFKLTDLFRTSTQAKLNKADWKRENNSNQRLASLSIMRDQLRAPFSPSDDHSAVIWRGLRRAHNWAYITPRRSLKFSGCNTYQSGNNQWKNWEKMQSFEDNRNLQEARSTDPIDRARFSSVMVMSLESYLLKSNGQPSLQVESMHIDFGKVVI